MMFKDTSLVGSNPHIPETSLGGVSKWQVGKWNTKTERATPESVSCAVLLNFCSLF